MSGTVLASTTASYSSGWYQVVINWLSSNLINVNIYNPSGALFGTLNTTDSTYSSGGMGFTYWSQHGGWDFYTARQYAAGLPTYTIGPPQANYGATWMAAQDTALTGTSSASIGQNIRLRFSIQNSSATTTGQYYLLQVAPLGGYSACESVPDVSYSSVSMASSGCGTSPVCMASSTQFTNLTPTSPSLSYPAWMKFTPGEIMQSPSNETGSSTLPSNTATELEYNFQFTSYATSHAYCLRTTNAGTDFANYDHVAEAQVLHAPTIVGGVSLNNGQDIKLVEGTTTTVLATATVQDFDGYSDIVQGTSTIYRSGVAGGANCTSSLMSCYQVPASQCTYSGCSGTQCLMTCAAKIEYFADATDASSSYVGQTWMATMSVVDSTNLYGSATVAGGVPLDSLLALEVTSPSINFGALINGADTGSTNATTTIINTGNAPIDVKVSGDPLNGTGGPTGSIPVNSQKYATSTFVYGGCALCQVLTGPATPASIGVNLPQATSTAGSQPSSIYFGLQVPTNINSGSYSGTNYFTAVIPGS